MTPKAAHKNHPFSVSKHVLVHTILRFRAADMQTKFAFIDIPKDNNHGYWCSLRLLNHNKLCECLMAAHSLVFYQAQQYKHNNNVTELDYINECP